MAFSGLNNFLSDSPSPHKRNGDLSPSVGVPKLSNDLVTPTKQQLRSSSQVLSLPISEAEFSLGSPNALSTFGTPTSEANNPWSSAVGRAGTGKSGRVIEKLMGDNDRLSRDQKLATAKLEEEVKRGESARSALESLQISNANLLSIHETDKSFLSKKDRKIEELKAELASERVRRERAETETRDTRKERDEVVERLRRETVEDREQSRRATSQYDVLSKSWKSLEEKYERQTGKLKADLNTLRTEIDGDKEKLAHLEVIMEQLRQETEKIKKIKEKLFSDFQFYKTAQEAGIEGMRATAERNDATNDQAQKQMATVLGEMKHVVNVQRDFRDAK